MSFTDIQRSAPAPSSVNTHQQQHAWPTAPLINSQARHQAFTDPDTAMAWASDDDPTQPAADQAVPVLAVPHSDNALHSSHYLAGPRQPLQSLSNQLCYSLNSGNKFESAHMPAGSASMQAACHQYSLHAAPSSLPHQQAPAAQQTQPTACFLITKDNALQTSQPTATTQSSQLWSATTEGKDNATALDYHQAASPSPAPVHLHAAATSYQITQNPSNAAAPAAALAGALPETAATPTTIKAPLNGLAASSQACCVEQQHLNGSSSSPAMPAGVTAGVCAWKREKNALEACLVCIALLVMMLCYRQPVGACLMTCIA